VRTKVAITVAILALLLNSSCAALHHFDPAYNNFEQGLALFNQGRFTAAASFFERATRENPDMAEAYLYLGRSYISQSRWSEAIQPLRTAFRLAPKESQQEIMNLIIDASVAAALNDFHLGDRLTPPARLNDP